MCIYIYWFVTHQTQTITRRTSSFSQLCLLPTQDPTAQSMKYTDTVPRVTSKICIRSSTLPTLARRELYYAQHWSRVSQFKLRKVDHNSCLRPHEQSNCLGLAPRQRTKNAHTHNLIPVRPNQSTTATCDKHKTLDVALYICVCNTSKFEGHAQCIVRIT